MFGAGWVTRDVHAYCYNCDEDELSSRARETVAEREMAQAVKAVDVQPMIKAVESQPSSISTPAQHYRSRNPRVQALVEERIVPGLLQAFDHGEEIFQKAKRWRAEDGVKHWTNTKKFWQHVQNEIATIAESKDASKLLQKILLRFNLKHSTKNS